jgi:hypothetical protein
MNLSLPAARCMLERNSSSHEDWANIGHEGHRARLPLDAGRLRRHLQPEGLWGEHFHPHDLDRPAGSSTRSAVACATSRSLIPERAWSSATGSSRGRTRLARVARGLARKTLFNRATVPPLQRRLAASIGAAAWPSGRFWKIMLHHTDAGYMASRRAGDPVRHPTGGHHRLGRDELTDVEDDVSASRADPQAEPQAARRRWRIVNRARARSKRRAQGRTTTTPRGASALLGRPSCGGARRRAPSARSVAQFGGQGAVTASAARSSWPSCLASIRDLIRSAPLRDAVDRGQPRAGS